MKLMKCILMFIVLGACAASAEDFSHIDYMKLNRKNMPHVQSLIQGALHNLDIAIGSAASLNRKFRMNGLFPKLRTYATYRQDGIAHKDWMEYTTAERYNGDDYSTPPSSDYYSRSSAESYSQTGYDSTLDWGVGLTWDLTDLVFSAEERSVISRKNSHASQIRRRTVDVGKRYALLMGALPPDETEEADPDMMAVILENASILDEWTGGLLTRILENMGCGGESGV